MTRFFLLVSILCVPLSTEFRVNSSSCGPFFFYPSLMAQGAKCLLLFQSHSRGKQGSVTYISKINCPTISENHLTLFNLRTQGDIRSLFIINKYIFFGRKIRS